jgi:hypothetical protein
LNKKAGERGEMNKLYSWTNFLGGNFYAKNSVVLFTQLTGRGAS